MDNDVQPIALNKSPLRRRCFICGEEIGPCTWHVEIRARGLPRLCVHKGCILDALEYAVPIDEEPAG